MKTISGREISVRANVSRRTFTIRTESAKYRTVQMSKDEFRSCERNTANDWQHFLNSTNGAYYLVK